MSDFLNLMNKIPDKTIGQLAGAAIAPYLVDKLVGDYTLLKLLSIIPGAAIGGDIVSSWKNTNSSVDTFADSLPKTLNTLGEKIDELSENKTINSAINAFTKSIK